MAKSLKYRIKILKIHSEKRGWLVEMLKRNELKEDIKQIYVSTIKPGYIRGNHYHLKRIEWFFLIGKGAELYLKNLQTKEKICLKLSTKKPKVITIFPKTAHAVKNTSKEIIYLISAQNTIYNPKNTDTYEHQIVTS